MNPIKGKLYSPFEKETTSYTFINSGINLTKETKKSWERFDATVNKVRESNGYPVYTYRQLVDEVAKITIFNKEYEMFYRGQRNDYKDSQGPYFKNKTPKTIIYPSICRPEKNKEGTYKASIKKTQIKKRYDDLYQLMDYMTKDAKKPHKEHYISLYQHYDILPTPLIDITQSLRVAATFALKNSEKGFIYVFGLPFPNGSISHFIDLNIVLVKLQNICPIGAFRPRYQEGYLVGKYPIRHTKEEGDNLARRLVAKFYLDNSDGKFWDKNFTPIPDEALFPSDDKYELILSDYLKRFREV